MVDIFDVFGPFLLNAVHENLLVFYLDGLPPRCDTSLDEVFRGVGGILENDDIAGSGVADFQNPFAGKRYLRAIEELRRNELVADKERILHRSRWYFEWLDKEGFNNDRKNECDQHRFDPFLAERRKSALFPCRSR